MVNQRERSHRHHDMLYCVIRSVHRRSRNIEKNCITSSVWNLKQTVDRRISALAHMFSALERRVDEDMSNIILQYFICRSDHSIGVLIDDCSSDRTGELGTRSIQPTMAAEKEWPDVMLFRPKAVGVICVAVTCTDT